jgi:hypothetical protein
LFQVLNVKKQIEQVQGAQTYPSEQQLLIYQGKVLKDETTIEENKVTENTFLVVMLSKVVFPLDVFWSFGDIYYIFEHLMQKRFPCFFILFCSLFP